MTEKYRFSNETKRWAMENSKGFGGREKKNVHHIVPRSVASKYGLDKQRITSRDNAIALEIFSFHEQIHQDFTEDDYIFLAQSLLGYTEEDFEKPIQNRRRGKKRRRRR